ncbi:hypothetical protein MMC13_005562 [Lambiella insularis]|nr:hypothetical protein [Lambiella insularis]
MQLSLSSCLMVLASTAALANAKSDIKFDSGVLHRRYNSPVHRRGGNMMAPVASTTAAAAAPAATLNATVVNCFLTVPANLLTAAGLATPFILNAPCSQTVPGQQSFAEASVYDPATGAISTYHPLIIDAGVTPIVPPVVPAIPAGATVGIWFGFNGGVLQLQDVNGLTPDKSPLIGAGGAGCINGLPGTAGDVFGQVSWCNAQPFFAAVNGGITAGKVTIPALGTDTMGNPCPTSRSFKMTDACPSDNVGTQYLINMKTRGAAQDTAANRAANANLTVINNASDEALLGHLIDPAIGCVPFNTPSLDDPGAMVVSLAANEIQAAQLQAPPLSMVPLKDPDCLLTATGALSVPKTNAYRLGVNQQPVAGNTNATVDPTGVTGALVPYCNGLNEVAPPFLADFQKVFINMPSPAACVGTNFFTFLCNRVLMSEMLLGCPPPAVNPIVCQFNGCGAATSCVITLGSPAAGNATGVAAPTMVTPPMASVAGATLVPTSVNPWGTAHRPNDGLHPDGAGPWLGSHSQRHRKHKHRKS